MLFDLVIGGLLFVFVALGAWRGAVPSILGLASLVVAYAGAIVGAARFGALAATTLGLPGVFGPLAGGTAGFLAGFVLMSFVGFFVKRWDVERRGDGRRGVDRAVGALFGGMRGLVIAGLIGYLGMLLDAARDVLPQSNALASVPSSQGSFTAAATESAIETLVETAVGDDPAGRVLARIAARPGERVKGLQRLLDDRRIQAVQDDEFFWTLVANGASERALNRMSFYSVSHDAALRGQLADLGLVSAEAAADSNQFRDELRGVLDEVGPRIKGLKNDPEIQALARDPEIVQLLQSGNTLGLLTHPRILGLAEKLSADAEVENEKAEEGDDLASR
jgi:uncharacterized membrane protein required for colicin V production